MATLVIVGPKKLGPKKRSEEIRRFILEHLEEHPSDVSKLASDHFKITRQAVNRHLDVLISKGLLIQEGQTKNRSYKLASLITWRKAYNISSGLAEHDVWRNDISEFLQNQTKNALDIWQYGFTEIFNNALDHSEGSDVTVSIEGTAITTRIQIIDNGVGIFKKIQSAFNLTDPRHSVLELAKGKLTTDPKRHTGEGIFFTSRMFDDFQILSGDVCFTHFVEDDDHDWIDERRGFPGTSVWMELKNYTTQTVRKVFDKYTLGVWFQ
jgi:anti-sigma regulatory factor (Ser/Thr protein kinase)/biotin operon repressor